METGQKTTREIPQRYLRPTELAKYLGVCRPFVYKLLKQGILPQPSKLGKATVWDVKKVDEVMEKLQGLPLLPGRPKKTKEQSQFGQQDSRG